MTILIADDDAIQRGLLQAMLRRFSYDCVAVESGEAALDCLASQTFDLLILDLVMPNLDGMAVLERLRSRGDRTPVIVQTSAGSIDLVTSAIRLGADDFIVKPVGGERLQVSIRNVLSHRRLESEARALAHRSSDSLTFADLAGQSADMKRVERLVQRAAGSSMPVLIEGEQGTGKLTIARAIHGSGDRSAKRFVALDCATLSGQDAEVVLFGHDKMPGKLLQANKGTLFLDHIDALPLDLQLKLLRAIQDNEIRPVHSKRPLRLDVQIISASHEDFVKLIHAGRFREDLYYRLHVFSINLPPLRNRREDINILAHGFLARFAAEEGRRVRSISAEALALLTHYDWPGNVRQLEAAIYRAVTLAQSDEIGLSEFPQITAVMDGFSARIPVAPVLTLKPVAAGPAMISGYVPRDVTPLRDPHSLSIVAAGGDMRTMEAIEADVLKFALRYYRGQMSEVARRLGIGRSTLYRRLKELGLDSPAQSICGVEDTRFKEAAA